MASGRWRLRWLPATGTGPTWLLRLAIEILLATAIAPGIASALARWAGRELYRSRGYFAVEALLLLGAAALLVAFAVSTFYRFLKRRSRDRAALAELGANSPIGRGLRPPGRWARIAQGFTNGVEVWVCWSFGTIVMGLVGLWIFLGGHNHTISIAEASTAALERRIVPPPGWLSRDVSIEYARGWGGKGSADPGALARAFQTEVEFVHADGTSRSELIGGLSSLYETGAAEALVLRSERRTSGVGARKGVLRVRFGLSNAAIAALQIGLTSWFWSTFFLWIVAQLIEPKWPLSKRGWAQRELSST